MKKFYSKNQFFLAFFVSIFLFIPNKTYARVFVWTGGAGDNMWTSTNNWNDSEVQIPGNLYYPGSDVTKIDTVYITIGGNLNLIFPANGGNAGIGTTSQIFYNGLVVIKNTNTTWIDDAGYLISLQVWHQGNLQVSNGSITCGNFNVITAGTQETTYQSSFDSVQMIDVQQIELYGKIKINHSTLTATNVNGPNGGGFYINNSDSVSVINSTIQGASVNINEENTSGISIATINLTNTQVNILGNAGLTPNLTLTNNSTTIDRLITNNLTFNYLDQTFDCSNNKYYYLTSYGAIHINGNITSQITDPGVTLGFNGDVNTVNNPGYEPGDALSLNGNFTLTEGAWDCIGIVLNITGNLTNNSTNINAAHCTIANTSFATPVYVGSKPVFTLYQERFEVSPLNGADAPYATFNGSSVIFSGAQNSVIKWPGGFGTDTIKVQKTGNAKVTSSNPLFTTQDLVVNSGKLELSADTAGYKLVVYNNMTIMKGGAIVLLAKGSKLPNIAVGGNLNDYNTVIDSANSKGLVNASGATIVSFPQIPSYNDSNLPSIINLQKGSVKDLILCKSYTLYGEFTGQKSLSPANDLTVNNCYITDGNIILNNNNLIVQGALDSIIYDNQYPNSAHIYTNGKGSLTINALGTAKTNVTFPISASLSETETPVTINNKGTTDNFTVRVADSVFTNGTPDTTFKKNIVNKTWFITEAIPGGSNADVSFGWNNGDQLTGFNPQNTYVSRFANGNWSDIDSTFNTTGQGPYVRTRPGVTAFSEFALSSNLITSGTVTAQTITFPPLSQVSFGSADINPGATSTDTTIPITYKSSDTTVATIIANQIHITGAGKVNISAYQSGNIYYNAADSVTQSLTVIPAAQTITFNTLGAKTYGNSDFDPGAVTSSGLPVTYDSSNPGIATIVHGLIHIVGAGIDTITAVQDGDDNYKSAAPVSQLLTVAPANLTVTADNETKTLGSANPVLSITYSGFVNGEDTSKLITQPVATTTAATDSPLGTYPITVSGGASTNYAFNYQAGTLTIVPETAPLISAFIPASGFPGTNVTIQGANLSGVTSVSFGGTAAASFVNTNASLITAVVGDANSGTITLTTPTDTTTSDKQFTILSTPVIEADGSTTFINGGSVTLSAANDTGFVYQWALNGTNIQGATSPAFTATKSGSYTLSVTANGISQNSQPIVVDAQFKLPADNFALTITGATCDGSNNGFIHINAIDTLNYTTAITGNGLNSSYPFTDSLTVNNLSPGTYSLCITVAGESNYSQCYDAVITQPANLSVYSSINDKGDQVTLSLSGGNSYNIQLNGLHYSTTSNTITLPAISGNNTLSVTTDKLCQGVVQKIFNTSAALIPYPDPFSNTVNLNLGNDNISQVIVEIHDIIDGKTVFTKQYANQSGVLQLDLSALNKGVYALHLSMDNTEKMFKILKK